MEIADDKSPSYPGIPGTVRYEQSTRIPELTFEIRNTGGAQYALKNIDRLKSVRKFGGFTHEDVGARQLYLLDTFPAGRILGLDRGIAVPSNWYTKVRMFDHDPGEIAYRDEAYIPSLLQGDVATITAEDNKNAGYPLLDFVAVGRVMRYLDEHLYKLHNYRRGDKLLNMSHASADLTFMNGNINNLIALANVPAITYMNELSLAKTGKNLWDVEQDPTDVDNGVPLNYRKLAIASQVFNIVEGLDRSHVNGQGIYTPEYYPFPHPVLKAQGQFLVLRENTLTFQHLMSALVKGDRETLMKSAEQDLGGINFVMHYLFCLVKTGEYRSDFSDEQIRKMVVTLSKCEVTPTEFTKESAQDQSAFSSTLARLEDLQFSFESPKAFSLVEFWLDPMQKHNNYVSRISSHARVKPSEIGLKSIDQDVAQWIVPKGNHAVFEKVHGGDPKKLEQRIAKYRNPIWRRLNKKEAENLEFQLAEAQFRAEELQDVVRSTILVEPEKHEEIIAEIKEQDQVQADLFLDSHDLSDSENPKREKYRIDIKDEAGIVNLKKKLGVPEETTITELIEKWTIEKAVSDSHSAYGGIHAHAIVNVPLDIYGRDRRGILPKHAQIRIWLTSLRPQLVRSHTFYKDFFEG